MRLTKLQRLFLRLIAAAGCWTPRDMWADEQIQDGSGDVVPNVGGGGHARCLQSLVDKGLVRKPYDWWGSLSVTPEGEAVVRGLKTT